MHSRMMEIEDESIPNFNNVIEELVPLTNEYFDMTSSKVNLEIR